MDLIKMYEELDHHRRRFLRTAAGTIAAAQFGMMGFADAQPSKTKLPAVTPGANSEFASTLSDLIRSTWRFEYGACYFRGR